MKVFLVFCLAMAIGIGLYESAQWFRPADYSLAADRWFAMVTGAFIWRSGKWSQL